MTAHLDHCYRFASFQYRIDWFVILVGKAPEVAYPISEMGLVIVPIILYGNHITKRTSLGIQNSRPLGPWQKIPIKVGPQKDLILDILHSPLASTAWDAYLHLAQGHPQRLHGFRWFRISSVAAADHRRETWEHSVPTFNWEGGGLAV